MQRNGTIMVRTLKAISVVKRASLRFSEKSTASGSFLFFLLQYTEIQVEIVTAMRMKLLVILNT